MKFENECRIIGRLTKDPVVKTTKDGRTEYAEINVAVKSAYNRSLAKKERQNGNPNVKEEATYLRFNVFGKRKDFVAQYFVQGSPIAITFEIVNNNYTDPTTNKTVYGFNFMVEDVNFVPFAPNQNKNANKNYAQNQQYGNPQQAVQPPVQQPTYNQQAQYGTPQQGQVPSQQVVQQQPVYNQQQVAQQPVYNQPNQQMQYGNPQPPVQPQQGDFGDFSEFGIVDSDDLPF